MCKRDKGCAREIKENVLKRGGCKRERWVRDRKRVCEKERSMCARKRRMCEREKRECERKG